MHHIRICVCVKTRPQVRLEPGGVELITGLALAMASVCVLPCGLGSFSRRHRPRAKANLQMRRPKRKKERRGKIKFPGTINNATSNGVVI